MDDTEARQLLLDAGIPEEMITRDTLDLASAIGDGIARAFAKKVAQRLVEADWPEMLRNLDAARDRFAQLGIHVASEL